jgi:hypothetical protein
MTENDQVNPLWEEAVYQMQTFQTHVYLISLPYATASLKPLTKLILYPTNPQLFAPFFSTKRCFLCSPHHK